MEIKFNVRKKYLYFLVGIVLVAGIVGLVIATKPTPVGHTWSEVECTTDFCVTPGGGPTLLLGRVGGQSSIKSPNGQNLFLDAGSDKTTGLNYFSTGNVILAYANGAGGNVGIGESNPERKLDVVGNVRIDGELEMDTAGSHINMGGQNIDDVYQIVASKIVDRDHSGHIYYFDGNERSQLVDLNVVGELCLSWDGPCISDWADIGGGTGTCSDCDTRFLNRGGDSMLGNFNMGGNTINNVWDVNAQNVIVGTNVNVAGTVNMGYERRVSTATSGSAAIMFCTPGKKIIGGGCSGTGDIGQLVNSYPNSEDSWYCSWSGPGGNVYAIAICARIGN
ncbi:MAG: hypothetical protein KJ600_00250 [Nanoarchaeota archaeon]|nr:hypothetical protein [Nanoarchaeota archaeon]MBU1102976.1 hypothetical protein [Nanoarchaeota archaeon]